jgi:hypothetical protein
MCQGLLIMEGFTITFRHAAIGRTPLDQWSARRRDLYLTTYNTRKGQTSMSTGWIRTHYLSKRAAAHPRLRPRGYRDQPVNCQCNHVKDGEIYVECSLYTEFWLGSLRIKNYWTVLPIYIYTYIYRYIGRAHRWPSKHPILYIFSTNIRTEFF